MIIVEDLHKNFGGFRAVDGASIQIRTGSITGLIGPNGAGKTTLFNVIAGRLPPTSGRVMMDGEDITGLPPHELFAKGLLRTFQIAHEFGSMTVRENLELGAHNPTARPQMARGLDEVFDWFPVLAERRTQLAGSLSGGERSMCALARAVMSRPKLLMLDEPSLGLSPLMVKRVFGMIAELARTLSITIVLVEQYFDFARDLADDFVVLDRGEVVVAGDRAVMARDEDEVRRHLTV
jgi:branched-chain amino acid transport system ATP-binding protein